MGFRGEPFRRTTVRKTELRRPLFPILRKGFPQQGINAINAGGAGPRGPYYFMPGRDDTSQRTNQHGFQSHQTTILFTKRNFEGEYMANIYGQGTFAAVQ